VKRVLRFVGETLIDRPDDESALDAARWYLPSHQAEDRVLGAQWMPKPARGADLAVHERAELRLLRAEHRAVAALLKASGSDDGSQSHDWDYVEREHAAVDRQRGEGA
jgi:hypothetical protein